MPSSVSSAVKHLRRAVFLRDGASLSDGQLLERFITSRDETAFEVLVRRHGPMVLGVCQRLLGHIQDTEDAFQTTFLVLVRKAASVVPREMLPNWLYGVAHQTALKARAMQAKRRTREQHVPDLPEPAAVERENLWADLHPLLDRELSRLPDKYRVAIVLCDLEGKTRPEAARQLGVPEGTVSSRLSRAREMLAKRLTRHGLGLSAGALAAALAEGATSAGVPSALVASTVQAASLAAAGPVVTGVISAKVAILTEGVLRSMLLTKLKIGTAMVLAVGVLGASVGTSVYGFRGQAGGPAVQIDPGRQGAQPTPDIPKQGADSADQQSGQDKNQPAAKEPAAVRALQKERFALLQEMLAQTVKRRESGSGSRGDVLSVEVEVAKAEFDLCESDEARAKTLQKWLMTTQGSEAIASQLLKKNLTSQHEFDRAKLARLEVEIDLERVRARMAARGK